MSNLSNLLSYTPLKAGSIGPNRWSTCANMARAWLRTSVLSLLTLLDGTGGVLVRGVLTGIAGLLWKTVTGFGSSMAASNLPKTSDVFVGTGVGRV